MKFSRTTLLMACAASAACNRVPSHAYECSPAQALTVQYINSPGAESRALLTLNGAAYTLTQARSASGARYVTTEGRSPGATLVWWNKGNEGTLLEGRFSGPDAAEQLLATCTQAP